MCAAGTGAQTQETKTTIKTKIEMKGGKNLRADHRNAPSRYALVSDDDQSSPVASASASSRSRTLMAPKARDSARGTTTVLF
jgi:hypothetical protein